MSSIDPTVGIELEYTSITRDTLRSMTGWKVESDGSVRNYGRDKEMFPKLFVSGNRGTEYGGEVVSPIIKLKNVKERLLEQSFLDYKEASTASSSIHIHVGVANLVRIGWNLIGKYFQYMRDEGEKSFYDCSAPNQTPRGLYNNFLYYRPLKNPLYTRAGGLWRASLGNIEKIHSLNDFMFAYGRLDQKCTKWWPSRYCGVNFLPLTNYGTIEFRMFNFTNNPNIILAWIYAAAGSVLSMLSGQFVDAYESAYLGASLAGEEKPFLYTKILESISQDVFSKIPQNNTSCHNRYIIPWENTSGNYTSRRFELLAPEVVSEKSIVDVKTPHPLNGVEKDSVLVY